jgi:hypothetical protein
VSFVMTALIVAACSGGAAPAFRRESRTTAAASPSAAPSADPSRLRVSTGGWKTDFTIWTSG